MKKIASALLAAGLFATPLLAQATDTSSASAEPTDKPAVAEANTGASADGAPVDKPAAPAGEDAAGEGGGGDKPNLGKL